MRYIVPSNIEKIRKRLKSGESIQIKIVSDSMYPILKVNHFYNLKAIPRKYVPKLFDIFVYWDGEKLIAHYFDEKTELLNNQEQVWIFRSIKSRVEDFPVSKNCVIGLLDVKIPYLFQLYLRIRKALK